MKNMMKMLQQIMQQLMTVTNLLINILPNPNQVSLTINIALWNANGLSQHTLEVETFLRSNNIDVLLISETHFTQKHHFFIKGYSFYQAMHPDGKAHGGSAILIKCKIHHHESIHYCTQ